MTEEILETRLTSEQREMLETVAGTADSLVKIVNDVLNLSNLKAGGPQFDWLHFNVSKLVADAIRDLAEQARKKGSDLL